MSKAKATKIENNDIQNHNGSHQATQNTIKPKKISPIQVTELALANMLRIINSKTEKTILGIRIAILTKGCGGNAYNMEYAYTKEEYDEVMQFEYENNTINIYVDKKNLLFMFGTTIDYSREKLSEGFTFTNKKEKGRCGCGKSFYV